MNELNPEKSLALSSDTRQFDFVVVSGRESARTEKRSTVELHDSKQFEVKLHYPVTRSKATSYRVDTFLFVPRTLGVTKESYTRAQFYNDISTHIRLDPPVKPLATISVSELAEAIANVAADPQRRDRVKWELRFVASLIRVSSDTSAETIGKHLRDARGQLGRHTEALARMVDAYIADAADALKRFRGLREKIAQDFTDILETHAWADEYLSLCVEADMTRVVEHIDLDPEGPVVFDVRASLARAGLAEQEHRRAKGYQTFLAPGQAAEYFVHRAGVLKKFVGSVLFLDTEQEKSGTAYVELGAAIAAGVAMFISLLIAALTQTKYSVNTVPFLTALVVGYVLKDRIKEWLKRYFAARLGRIVADQHVSVHEPGTKHELADWREFFTVQAPSELPPEIIAQRHGASESELEIENKPEVVLRYQKHLRLFGNRLVDLYGGIASINEVIRINVADLLLRADDPSRPMRVLGVDSSVLRIDGPKVYHINVVFALHAVETGRVTYGCVRVVCDRDGIKRLESAR